MIVYNRTEYSESIRFKIGQETKVTGNTIIFYNDVSNINIYVNVAENTTFTIEVTASTREEIEAGTAKWYDLFGGMPWDSVYVQLMQAPSAIRFNNCGNGILYYSIRCQRGN